MAPINLVQFDESALHSRILSLRSTLDIEEAEIALDFATSYLYQLSKSLRALWNSLAAPISRLPEEILARILTEVVPSSSPGYSGRSDWERRVRLSTVCKTWRKAALGCAAYWAGTRLGFGWVGMQAMLPRWKGHPRRVGIHLSDLLDEASLPRARARLQMLLSPAGIIALDVIGECSRFFDTLWEVMPQEWNSSMETLNIYGYLPSPDTGDAAMVPAHMLDGTVCVLQNLILDQCTVDWKPLEVLGTQITSAFRELRKLEFTNLISPPPPTVLNNILSSSHHLEDLQIIQSFPENFDPTFQLPNPSSVETLHIECSLTTLAKTFSQMVSVPTFDSMKSLRLVAIGSPNSEVPATEAALPLKLLGKFSGFANSLDNLREKRVLVTDTDSHFSVQVRPPAAIFEDDCIDSIRIDYTPDIVAHEHFPFLMACWVIEIGILRLDIDPERLVVYPSDVWNFLFLNQPNVETLELSYLDHWDVRQLKNLTHFLSILSPLGTLFLPKLKKLCVIQISQPQKHPIMRYLEVMLKARWDSGSPVAVVEFQSCELSSGALSMLRQRIPAHVTEFLETEEPGDWS